MKSGRSARRRIGARFGSTESSGSTTATRVGFAHVRVSTCVSVRSADGTDSVKLRLARWILALPLGAQLLVAAEGDARAQPGGSVVARPPEPEPAPPAPPP